ncbi:hypothetical protein B0H10DRAFT_2233019 [Mycena sp. CBHHK59/15]|nr:hypothetical protein B0H10DRAFT_2233019 [Mycena sp. CBHHK59/15]
MSDPSKVYDTGKFGFPLPLKDPPTLNSVETLMVAEFLNSTNLGVSASFDFNTATFDDQHSTDIPGNNTSEISFSGYPKSKRPPPPRSHHTSPVLASSSPPPPSSQPKKPAQKGTNKRSRDEEQEPGKEHGPARVNPPRRSSRAAKSSHPAAAPTSKEKGRMASKDTAKRRWKGWAIGYCHALFTHERGLFIHDRSGNVLSALTFEAPVELGESEETSVLNGIAMPGYGASDLRVRRIMEHTEAVTRGR